MSDPSNGGTAPSPITPDFPDNIPPQWSMQWEQERSRYEQHISSLSTRLEVAERERDELKASADDLMEACKNFRRALECETDSRRAAYFAKNQAEDSLRSLQEAVTQLQAEKQALIAEDVAYEHGTWWVICPPKRGPFATAQEALDALLPISERPTPTP